MSGALYIWFFGACFVCVVGIMALFTAILLIGHWRERRETGANHGFLEVPEASRSRPARTPVQQNPTQDGNETTPPEEKN